MPVNGDPACASPRAAVRRVRGCASVSASSSSRTLRARAGSGRDVLPGRKGCGRSESHRRREPRRCRREDVALHAGHGARRFASPRGLLLRRCHSAIRGSRGRGAGRRESRRSASAGAAPRSSAAQGIPGHRQERPPQPTRVVISRSEFARGRGYFDHRLIDFRVRPGHRCLCSQLDTSRKTRPCWRARRLPSAGAQPRADATGNRTRTAGEPPTRQQPASVSRISRTYGP